MESILNHCNTIAYDGHFGGWRTVIKVLQSGFYWPSLFKDGHRFVSTCDKCQRMGSVRRSRPSTQPDQEYEPNLRRGPLFYES